MAAARFDLQCAGATPLSFRRAVESHGLTGVSPWRRASEGVLFVAVEMAGGAGLVSLRSEAPDVPGAAVEVDWSPASTARAAPTGAELEAIGRRLLGIERDLAGFHSATAGDPDLDWVPAAGAGAIARGATVFEDVIRTLLTTNTTWSGTVAMCSRLVAAYGDRVPSAESGEGPSHAFPRPEVLARLDAAELREAVRLGYRSGSLIAIAESVACGEVDLELLGSTPADELADEEVAAILRGLPGFGPYASAHAMLLIGRPALPILDSWTRPKYGRVTGRPASDREIRARVSRYGPDAGLALWLILTRDWFGS